ncbi:MAG: aldehyde dehydrogenase [Spirochaetota bacterium]
MNPDVKKTIADQRVFFLSGATKDVVFRIKALKRFAEAIHDQEEALYEAFRLDFRKPPFEVYSTEIAQVLEEISFAVRHLASWAAAECVPTHFSIAPGRSTVIKEPYGTVLIIAPWNYPFMLLLSPFVGAIAAGNTAMMKTAPASANVSAVIRRIIEAAFPREHAAVFEGHRDVNKALLAERYDYIFFTGGEATGRVVMEAAAKHLTPLTLELGGKSPCIVLSDIDVRVTARRIVWGKFINAGQTCIAPDYLLVARSVKETLIEAIRNEITRMYGEPKKSPDYPRIINKEQYDRLVSYLAQGEVLCGGETIDDERYIAPTLIAPSSVAVPLMQEEVFGPILPVIEISGIEDAIAFVAGREKPLALYLFTRKRSEQRRIIRELSFGGGTFNDTVLHIANVHLPFGGVGFSGMGAYHGKTGFDTFTHRKGILTKPFVFDVPLRYPPYTKWVHRLVKFIFG